MSRSKLATIKIAKQSSKGTAATTGFHCGLVKASGFMEDWKFAEQGVEHGCAAGSAVYRDLAQRSRTFYTVPGNVGGSLYPNMIGVILLGLGFSDSVSGTTAKTHVMTASTAANDPWLTVLHNIIADVGSDAERKAVDCRTTSLKFTADQNGVSYDAQFNGLSVGLALGTETKTDEAPYKLLRGSGTFALTFDPAGTPAVISSHSSNPPRTLEATITNPVQEDSYALWSNALTDLPRGEGIAIEGKFGGLPVQYSVMKQLGWGGASGTAPSGTWLPCSISAKFNAGVEITTGVPYSLQLDMPRAEVWLDPASFNASGGDTLLWTANFRAFAGTATPFTATLINTIATY